MVRPQAGPIDAFVIQRVAILLQTPPMVSTTAEAPRKGAARHPARGAPIFSNQGDLRMATPVGLAVDGELVREETRMTEAVLRRIMETAAAPKPQETPRVLVVEDEPDIAALIAYQLTREGLRVETASTGDQAFSSIGREVPDLLILDRMLPGISGDDVLSSLRAGVATRAIPVLILTAKREQEDRIRGLELGADDYLTKPFSPRELVLRVQSILRRADQTGTESGGRLLRAGPLSVDVNAHEATLDG